MTFNSALHPRGAAGSGQGGKFISANQNANTKEGRYASKQLGSLEAQRIRRYQRQRGLKVDGVIGHQTANALLGHQAAAAFTPGALTAEDRKALRLAAKAAGIK